MISLDECQVAVDDAITVMSSVRVDDLSKATPSGDWDVNALTNHLVGTCKRFACAIRGETMEASNLAADLVGLDPCEAYESAAAEVMAAWRTPGALKRTLVLPIGQIPAEIGLSIFTVDQLLHTWDLAQAIGVLYEIDDELAAEALRTLHMLITPDLRGSGKPFGEEIRLPPGATIQERLLAFSGRQP